MWSIGRGVGLSSESMTLRIRHARRTDARAIADVHVLSWRFGHRGLFPDDVVDGLSVAERELSWRETLANPMPGRLTLVADRDGRLVGFATSGPTRDPRSDPTTGELYELFVHPEMIGSGVGVALMNCALGHLGRQGFRTVTLWVLEGNERARRFYERQGLRTDGSVKTAAMGDAEAVEVRYGMDLAARACGPNRGPWL